MSKSTVPVRCLHTELWPIDRFKENPRNPNKHPESQIALLGQVIRSAGWRSPIVVSKRSGLVVKGHGRLAAAISEGFTHAPVEIQDYGSDAEELADMIADNRIAELAETDEFMLASTLGEIPKDELMKTGYTDAEFEAMCGEDAAPQDEADAPVDETPVFRFGKYHASMSPEETEQIEDLAEKYRLVHCSNWGFTRWLLDLVK